MQIIIADNHRAFLEQTKQQLNYQLDFEVVDTATNTDDLIQKVGKHRPKIVIMKYQMTGNSNVALDIIKNYYPKMKILALIDEPKLIESLDVDLSKADGILIKNDEQQLLTDTIRRLKRDERVVSPIIQKRFPELLEKLTGKTQDSCLTNA